MYWTHGFGRAGLLPWREMQRLHAEMERLIADQAPARASELPPIALWSNEAGLHLRALVPGFTKDEIELSVVADTFTIKAKRAEAPREEGQTFHRRERGETSLARTFTLPFTVDAEAVKASYENGVLDVELPRAASEKPRRISVASAN